MNECSAFRFNVHHLISLCLTSSNLLQQITLDQVALHYPTMHYCMSLEIDKHVLPFSTLSDLI